MSVHHVLPAALAIASLAAVAPVAQVEAPQKASEEVAAEDPWRRDRRITFTSESAARARDALAGGLRSELDRAVALMALGCARVPRDLARIESSAVEGGALERRAAILALGEMKAVDALSRLVDRGVDAGLEETLALALARTRTDAGLLELRVLGVEETTLGEHARVFFLLAGRERLPLEVESVDLLLRLRWEAGSRYGFVDGKTAERARALALSQDGIFLDRLLPQAALRILGDVPAVRDHLLEMTLARGGEATLRAAARCLAHELGLLMTNDEWYPEEPEEWRGILDGIRAGRNERPGRVVCRIALEESPLEFQAGELLLRGGGELPEGWLAAQMARADAAGRSGLVEALGERSDPARIPDIRLLAGDDPSPAVRAAALVALHRLGHVESEDLLQRVLLGEPDELRRELCLALARSSHDPRVRRYLLTATRLGDLDPDLSFTLRIALARHGKPIEHATLREWLLQANTADPRRVAVVQLLSEHASVEDVELLRELFAGENDPAFDVALIIALIENHQPSMLGFLRTVLWEGSWNQSILSGALLAEVLSVDALLDELDFPPPQAAPADLRRVGFALGEWGGMEAVEDLADRRGRNHPALQGAYLGALARVAR